MSISPTGNVYVQFSTIFQRDQSSPLQGFKASFSALSGKDIVQKVNDAKSHQKDILDLSPEGLRQSLLPKTKSDATDASLQSSEQASAPVSQMSEIDRVNLIRTNKNAVLERINELFAEKGIDVPQDQSFDITVDQQTGKLEIRGVDDPELLQAMNDAVAGDDQLVSLMKKTREDLGVPYPENVRPGNFTIGFDSMIPTPEDAEIAYQIDVVINAAKSMEAAESSEAEDMESSPETKTPTAPVLQFSILLTNKVPNATELLTDPTKTKSGETDETDNKSENSQLVSVTPEGKAEQLFRIQSRVEIDETGLHHFWSIINESASQEQNGARILLRTEIGGQSDYASGWTFAGIESSDDISALNAAFQDGMKAWIFGKQDAQTSVPDWMNEFAAVNGLELLG